jgi:class 3 adenylate cyclase/tetratricopeptide (TPR) repeat protein
MNEAGRKFCGECGSALVHTCPSCGTANPPGVKFCGECGTALTAPTAEPAPQARVAPAAERRLVSVLFADLVGFTAASESRDAEDTRELLSRYFDACRRLIELYGGTVEKFIGDAVMAVWGTPTATEDDAERAVRAALDLVAAVTALGDEIGLPELRARAGVLTGEAAVTIGAEGQGMVAGDLVNTASRIQSIAEPGSVLVGEATRRATDQTIVYAEAGTHELKGKAGLIPLWQALRVVSGARGALKSAGLEAPFVGRDRELRRIKDLFHMCADERRPQLISIAGIAGIGKSRLAWEFYKYFDGLPQITYWHRGRCLSYGEGVTYWALADMVRMRARIAEDEEPASALTKLTEVVEQHLSDAEERRFVEPRLRHLLGLEEGRFEREDLFAAWRLFIERLADVYPTVMVFEDMQWADTSLLDFIEYLLEWSRTSPLFVVTLARPELQERRPGWGAATRNFTSVFLEPLPEDAMEELLAGLVPGLPDELRTQILERAEGIPLYAVETVRMLLDRSALVQEGAVYRPTATIEALEVPETLHALIAARLDGLNPEERRVLQDGAVLGKTFTKHAVAALSGLSEAELDPVLSSLTRKEVLGMQADPRSPEHGQFGFLQDLLRRVAYETLSRADRKAKHLEAAAYLEAAWGEHEVVEVVASHYLDAYETAPDAADASEIRAKAGEQLARAGERAASLGASEEGERYYAQAAALADDPVRKAELDDQAGRMALLGARTKRARELLDEAHEAFENAGLRKQAARVSAVLADIDFLEGHPSQAVARLDAALAELEGEEPNEDLAVVAAQLGRFLVLDRREYERAAPHLERALELAEALRLPEVFAQALTSKSLLYISRNRLEEARILLEGALDRAVENDLHAAALRANNNLGVVFESSDRYDESVALTERGLELARRAGNRVWEEAFIGGAISGLVLLGRWDEAVAAAAQLEPDRPDTALLLTHLATVYCARGETGTARQLLANPLLRDSEDLQAISALALAEATVLRTEGKPREALSRAEVALAPRAELGITFLSVKLALVEALEAAFSLADTDRVQELVDDIEALRPGERPPLLEAHSLRFRSKLSAEEGGFKAATALFRELSLTFWLAVTLLEHGELLAEHDRAAAAEPLLEEAREIFERLEATPWLERVDRVATPAQVPA